MNINVTTSHQLKFHVAYHEHAEGGMDTDQFGSAFDDLHNAIRVLELARIQQPGHDWVIVCEVETIVSAGTTKKN